MAEVDIKPGSQYKLAMRAIQHVFANCLMCDLNFLERANTGAVAFDEFKFNDFGVGRMIDIGATDYRELPPRRYCANEHGRRVLIGLSIEETLEFEELERLPAVEERAQAPWSSEGSAVTIREKRWLELYVKHDKAWRTWAAENVSQKTSSGAAG